MRLTRLEKERLTDGRLKLQSVANSLKHVDPSKVESLEEIEDCLEAAENSIRSSLRADSDSAR